MFDGALVRWQRLSFGMRNAQGFRAAPRPRFEIANRLWAYIAEHELRDASNRRRVHADARLRAVVGGRATVSMPQLTGLVTRHLRPG